MLRIAVRVHNDEQSAKACYSWDDVNEFFFNPCYDDAYVIPLQVHGKTYAEKKADLQAQAVDFSNVVGSMVMSWGESAYISDFFERNGRRYGLLREFQENGIC